MKFKIAVSAILVFLVTLTGVVEAAYDLPKIKVEKENKHKHKSKVKKEKIIKSDWKNFSEFENELKNLVAENPNLSPDDSRRVGNDKNLIFVAFYKGRAFFLDKYSIEIVDNDEQIKTWEQHIFPIGAKISGKNSRVVEQTFHTENGKFYNSSKCKNDLDEIADEEDKIFMVECFKVGYHYAFEK